MESRQKASLISTENELREAFAKLHDTWDFPRLFIEPTRVVLDFEEYDDAGRPQGYIELPTVYRLMPPRNLDSFRDQLLVLPCIPAGPFVKKALEAHVAVADPNGAFYYKKGKVYFGNTGSPLKRFRFNKGAKDLFSGKSERIVRALLFNVSKKWSQKDLAESTGTSTALVNKVIKGLEDRQFIDRHPYRQVSLLHERELLDIWHEKRVHQRVVRYSIVGTGIAELADMLLQWAEKNGARVGFTQWVGAWQRAAFTEPVVCSAYVSRIPDLSELSPALVGRRVEQGGNLLLYYPEDQDVLRQLQRSRHLPLVSDAQIYIDLKGQGLRSEEALEALEQCPDFCRNHEI